MFKSLCLLCAALCPLALSAQYVPTSTALNDPATMIPIIQQSADFWLPAYDDVYGGFFSDVGIDGSPTSNWKVQLSQSRNAYGMVKAFMVTGDETYLDYAEGALQFMYDHGWDGVNGGWYSRSDREGSQGFLNWENPRKWFFWQHYMLLGIGVMIEATDGQLHKDWMQMGNEINDEELWDDTPGMEGYWGNANLDWSNKRDKGFGPTVDAVTTNALRNVLLTRERSRERRLDQVATNMTDYLSGSMDAPGVVVSFPSEFNGDWEINQGADETSIGHMIKTGWCLGRAFLINPDPAYKAGLEKIFDQVWEYDQGGDDSIWNHDYGVPRGEINWKTGQITNEHGDWWTVEQAVVGGLVNWYISRKDSYLQMADEAIDFYVNNYIDETHGEVYSVVSATGQVLQSTKGNDFKAGYHAIELFYLTYVYGNLFLRNEPVELYYMFEERDEARTVELWPIAIEHERCVITAVELDDEPFMTFDGAERSITIPAGVSGKFKVTFENAYTFNAPAHVAGEWVQDWAGWVFMDAADYPWFYQWPAGWMYAGTTVKNSGWFYALKDNLGWVFTNVELFPLAYVSATGTWVDLSAAE